MLWLGQIQPLGPSEPVMAQAQNDDAVGRAEPQHERDDGQQKDQWDALEWDEDGRSPTGLMPRR